LHLKNDLGLTKDRRPITDLHASGAVGLIREKRAGSGAALDDDLESGLDQPPRHVRRQGDAPLIGGDFLRHSDAHAV